MLKLAPPKEVHKVLEFCLHTLCMEKLTLRVICMSLLGNGRKPSHDALTKKSYLFLIESIAFQPKFSLLLKIIERTIAKFI